MFEAGVWRGDPKPPSDLILRQYVNVVGFRWRRDRIQKCLLMWELKVLVLTMFVVGVSRLLTAGGEERTPLLPWPPSTFRTCDRLNAATPRFPSSRLSNLGATIGLERVWMSNTTEVPKRLGSQRLKTGKDRPK